MTQATQTISADYKQTEIGVIPVDWDIKRLGKMLDYEQPTKYLVKEAEYSDDYKIPVLTAGKTFILGYTSEETGVFDNLPVIIFDDFTTANKFVDFPFKAKSSAMKMLKPRNKNANLRFLFEKMQLIDFKLGDHKRYWISEYQNIKVEMPKSKEQTAIATVLSDTDTLIEKLEKLIAKKKSIKQGTMQQLLTGRKRLPGFSGEWKVKRFEKIFNKYPSKKHQIQTTEYLEFGKYSVIDQGKKPVVAYSDEESKVFVCPKIGIIVFGDHTREIKFINFDFVVGADGTQLLSTNDGYDSKFTFYLLKTQEIPSTGYNRHFKYLKEIDFLFPPTKEEQTAIATVLSDMDAEIEKLKNKLNKYRQIKTGMMQQLLTGKIRLVKK